ncbi:uncharacterized protein [Nicotiana tomentosiformis]|uniref:uncharacterized protein n=1 Tax=Nicotiana tomentosiformis TaxID=4098 RepID=UPI00388C88EC
MARELEMDIAYQQIIGIARRLEGMLTRERDEREAKRSRESGNYSGTRAPVTARQGKVYMGHPFHSALPAVSGAPTTPRPQDPYYTLPVSSVPPVRGAFSGLPYLEWRGTLDQVPSRVVSFLKARRMVEKWCDAYLAYVRDVSTDTLIIESVPVMRDYSDIFPADLPDMPPDRDINFGIDLLPSTQPISITPYHIAPAELKELKEQLQELLDKGKLDEAKKVATAAIYLHGEAKLCWRVKYEAIRAGENTLNTWVELKAAIRLQFFPKNVEYNARRKLHELRLTRSVRDYVREFSTLMLNIRDMGYKDKLFAFIEGLKPHARMELQRQRVDTMPKVIQAVECLGDYHMETQKDRPQPPVRGGYNGSQPSNGGPSRNGGDRSASKSKTPSQSNNIVASVNNNQGRKPPSECCHCGGEHWNNQFPNTQFNAYQTVEDGSDDDESDEAEQVRAFNAIVSSILETLAGTSAGNPKKNACPIAKKGKQKVDERPPTIQERTLMFVEMRVNGRPIRPMIDTGATHNYLASTQVQRLGLVVQKSRGRVKAINSPPQPVGRIAKEVPMKLGPYKGRINLRITIIDDFELIVGLEFLRQTNTIPVPYANMLLMMGYNRVKPRIIPCIPIKISAMQSKNGVKRHEPMVLDTLNIKNQQPYHRRQTTDGAPQCVKTCQACQKDKSDRSAQAKLLEPLPVPQRPWESISLNFITRLPKVGDLATILVIVDQFSKYATFIVAPQNISAEDTTRLFFSHIFKYWGLHKDITSDSDSRFTGKFWTHIFRCLGSKLSHNSNFHQQADGQTERFNDMLEEYLCYFATGSQKNWVKLLDAAQLCFNSQKCSSTNKSAFEIVTGQQQLLLETVNALNMPKSPRAASFSKE